jgi:DNA-nicking Smr family endonuclease
MASPKRQTIEQDPVIEKLEDGDYDRQLDLFRDQLEEAAAVLRRAYEAMKAENTLRS